MPTQNLTDKEWIVTEGVDTSIDRIRASSPIKTRICSHVTPFYLQNNCTTDAPMSFSVFGRCSPILATVLGGSGLFPRQEQFTGILCQSRDGSPQTAR
jgi:hypothetical protein